MAHIRNLIRDAAVLALTDQTDAEDRVLAARPSANPKGRLPALFVTILSERSERGGDCLPLERFPEIRIVGFVEGDCDSVDDDCDALALGVEKALEIDPSLGGVLHDLTLASTEIEFSRGDRSQGAVELVYRAEAAPTALADM